MDAPSLVRLAIGGLTLDTRAYRYQRDNPTGLRRGVLIVLLVGALVGFATMIGDLGEYFTQPDPQLVSETIYNGLIEMPWYQQLVATNPEFSTALEQLFTSPGGLSLTPTPTAALFGLVLTPILGLIGWFISGAFVHIAARAFGGAGSFTQTMATTALASATSLIALVQAVPYAESIPFALAIATSLLGLIANYVAVRETHGLPPWRSFWAVLLGPLLITVLLLSLYCCIVFVFAGAIGGLPQGAAR